MPPLIDGLELPCIENLWNRNPAFATFPWRCRLWVSWCRRGIKRRNSTTVLGSCLFRILKASLKLFPAAQDNLWPVMSNQVGFPISLDLLDLETYIHTMPVLLKGSQEYALQQKLLAPGMVFLDIGANHGLYTFHAVHLVGPEGRILAFEPQPRLFAALKATCNRGGMSNVALFQCALANTTGIASFVIPTLASGTGSLLPSNAALMQGKSFDVCTASLDEIHEQQALERIDLIKMDTEGSEYSIFEGAEKTLHQHKPFIWFEWNPEAQQRSGIPLIRFLDKLSNLGYRQVRFIAPDYPIFPRAETFDRLVNLIAIPDGREDEFMQLAQEEDTGGGHV